MIAPRPRALFQPFCVLAGLATTAAAMQIRDYTPERHDRFTGFPDQPVYNPDAWYGSGQYKGVGWAHNDSRQFALVSRQHIVCATHFVPGPGTAIRFLSADGSLLERTIVSSNAIQSAAGGNTDLSLCKLSAPIPASSGIDPFPYLNLASEFQYQNRTLIVFGWTARAGKGKLASFQSITGIGTLTWGYRFRYERYSAVNDETRDECRLEGGDSGSPSFMLHEEKPALLGIHTAISDIPFNPYVDCMDSFIPQYVNQFNALLAPEGYRMIPAIRETTTLASSSSSSPADLKSGQPGSLSFVVENTGAALAGNVHLELHFPGDLAPASVSAPGWVTESANGGSWIFRRATLAATTALTVTASWPLLPEADSIPVQLIQRSDSSAEVCQTLNFPLETTYAAWASMLEDPDPLADADGDGVPNLLEYAFGGDPLSGGRGTGGKVGSLPVFSVSEGRAGMSFAVRKDAAQRKLSYDVEFSDLLSGSWHTDPPCGWSQEEVEFDPPDDHFVQRRISFDAARGISFSRVRVHLGDE